MEGEPVRTCAICFRRRDLTVLGVCRVCRHPVLATEDVELSCGRQLRLTLYDNGAGRRVVLAAVDRNGTATGVAASFGVDVLPAVQAALSRLGAAR